MFHPQGPTVWELLVQGLSSTEQGYDFLAPKFDVTPFRTPEAILGPALAQLGGPRSIATALDLCCGTGAALRHLRPLCRDRVVGIDLSQGMLAVARRKTQEAPGEAPIDLVRGHVLALPLRAAFELVVCFGAFGHILPQEQDPFVAQIAQVLRPGGRFVCVTTPWPPWWSARYWRARGFNALMHVRNALRTPPFILYYLTLRVPEVVTLLRQHGFAVTVDAEVFPECVQPVRLVIGTLTDQAKGPRTASAWDINASPSNDVKQFQAVTMRSKPLLRGCPGRERRGVGVRHTLERGDGRDIMRGG